MINKEGELHLKIKFMVLSFSLILLSLLSGCTVNTFQIQNLMRPPKSTGYKAEIQKVIEEVTGSSIILKYPQRGEYRSAVIMKDVSGDGQEEAIAFYSTENDSEIHVMILSETNGVWNCSGDFRSQGTDIDKILFSDINNDGVEEIILGWSTYNNTDNYISVYYHDKGEYKDIRMAETYTDFLLSDINGDGNNEILLLSLSTYSSPAKAQLVKVNTNESNTNTIGVVEMDSEVIKYISVQYGSIDENTYGVYVDSMRSGDTLSTEIIYWDSNNNTLVNPLYKNKINYYDFVPNNMQIASKDIDGDGIIEIPRLTYGSGRFSETSDRESSIIICWLKYIITNESTSVVNVTASDYDDYIFMIPAEWYGKVEVSKEKETNSLIFSEIVNSLDDSSKLNGADILKIMTLSDYEIKKLKNSKEGFILLEYYENKYYIASIPEKDNHLSISEDQIKDRFILIDK